MGFRKLHVFARYDEFGNLTKSFCSINDPVTNDTISAELAGDWRHESESALVEAVMDAFFKKHFADKAMAESVQKVEELERLSNDFRKEMAELKEVTLEEIRSEAQAEIAKLENSVKIAVLTINQLLLSMEDDDDESDDPEDSND